MPSENASQSSAPRLHLFVYGTLQLPDILYAVVGARWHGRAAVLEGYARYQVRGKPYPAIVVEPTGSVSGLLYSEVGALELERLDRYEGELYERCTLGVRVGGSRLSAVGYVLGDRHSALLSPEAWDLAAFERNHLAEYLGRISLTQRAP
ncbi:MAG: gamma-glutamylcyclotransferase family protein [Deltaproteobacteria bacterium]